MKEINAMSVCTLYIGDLAPYLRVVSHHMVDWMHTLFVSGVFNIIAHLFADALEPTNGYQRYADYLQPWEWPKKMASTSQMRKICTPKSIRSNIDAHKMKGSTSELLYVYSIVVHMTEEYVGMGVFKAAATVLIKFAIIVDLLLMVPRGNVDPCTLHVAVTDFMAAVVMAFSVECLTPKFHQLQHLARQLFLHLMLLSCWVHERKHNMLKQYCQDVRNTCTLEASVLGEVTIRQLNELKTTPGLGINQAC